MSQLNKKIISFEDIREINGEKVALCHGHFNIIHPGHIRYLEYANQLGTKLVVTVIGDSQFLTNSDSKHYFKEFDRSAGLAAIEAVDQII